MLNFLTASIHLDPLSIVRTGGYVGIAAFIFAENGILLGIFLPGDSLLFVGGLFSALGFLTFWLLLLIVVVAAIVGEAVGYWFGTYVGESFLTRSDSRFFKRSYLIRTQKFFTTYGGRAVVLGRFVPIVRTIAPILAGIGAMPYRRFFRYNILGACLWGGGMLSLGYFLGRAIPNSEHYVLPISLTIIVLSFLPVVLNLLRTKHT
jgi:membrane-associated protein